jgi:formate-dependent nitrite reductase membrane component NrfD
MDTSVPPPVSTTHPAPHRHRVGLAALLFGLAAAPLAWNFQVLFSSSLAGYVCFPHAAPLSAPLWSGWRPVLFAVAGISIAVAVLGGLVSLRNWQRTFQERSGSAHHLLDLGEGRTRFMAMGGMLIGALFIYALLFGATALWLVPPCG